MRKLNLVGKSFGWLTVTEEKGKQVVVLCKCGNTKTVLRSNVLAEYTKSCGCLHKLRTQQANTKHGLSNTTPLYKVWKRIRQKCTNPKCDQYKWYGARGIKCSSAWNDFTAFYDDMHWSYFAGATIERKDVNGDYSKENCCWIPASAQNKNKTNTRRS